MIAKERHRVKLFSEGGRGEAERGQSTTRSALSLFDDFVVLSSFLFATGQKTAALDKNLAPFCRLKN